MGHPSFAYKSEGNGDHHQKEDRKDKEERVVYYCHKNEEEKWKIMEAIVDTGCEATIVGEL